MTPKPEIAAMEAYRNVNSECKAYANIHPDTPITCVGALKHVRHIDSITMHLASVLDACIATLSNHVVIPEGEFAGIVSLLNEGLHEYKQHDTKAIDVMAQCFIDANAIAQKYAPEGK